MSEKIEDRLNSLELQAMEQDLILQDLSDMVNKQWKEIERLKAKLSVASERIITLEDNLPTSDAAHKPPHY
ncbi:MAG: SlyX family protein [Sneathiella sp.]|nr:SlyX family protein [Sneathiella sp.]